MGLNGVNSQFTENALFSIAMNETAGHETLREVDTYAGQQLVEMDFVSRSVEHAGDRWAYKLLPVGREKLAKMLGFRVVNKTYTLEDIKTLVEEALVGWSGECETGKGDESVYAKSAALAVECSRDVLKRVGEGRWDIAEKHAAFAADIEKYHTYGTRFWGPVYEAVKSMVPPE